MSVTNGSRKGSTKYNQAIIESSTSEEVVSGSTSRSGKDIVVSGGESQSKQTSKSTSKQTAETKSGRDLTSKSIVQRTSMEKANIGFAISFKVRVIGRFPKSPASC